MPGCKADDQVCRQAEGQRSGNGKIWAYTEGQKENVERDKCKEDIPDRMGQAQGRNDLEVG